MKELKNFTLNYFIYLKTFSNTLTLIFLLLYFTIINNVKICQINIRGILSQNTQNEKCKVINRLIQKYDFDVILLQEWSLLRIDNINKFNNLYIKDDGSTSFISFVSQQQTTNLATHGYFRLGFFS